MSARSLPTIALALLAAGACRDATDPTVRVPNPQPAMAASGKEILPNGKRIGTLADPMGPRSKYRTEYHLTTSKNVSIGTSAVYLIYYGSWSPSSVEPSIVTDFVAYVGGSPYFSISTLYPDANGDTPSGMIVYGGDTYDLFSRGAILTEQDIPGIISDAINSGRLPLDPNAVFAVMASPDISVTGLDTEFCALHNYFNLQGAAIKYAFIGGPYRSPSRCVTQMTGPNGGTAADAMVTLLATELFNAIVDPYLGAYYDRLGYEPGDKCAWTFGTTYTTANGAQANVRLGQRDFLLPQLWVPTRSGGKCALR